MVASDSGGEDVFWMQMLVLLVLAALWGVYSLVKTGANKLEDQQRGYPEYAGAGHTRVRQLNKALKALKNRRFSIFLKTGQAKPVIKEPVFDFDARKMASRERAKDELAKERGRDLHSGMEMLELDLLVSIVENTKGDDKDDVMIRKFSFSELLRREQLNAAGGNALKVYAMNEGNLYGKDIQCEAMKKLAERTGLRSG